MDNPSMIGLLEQTEVVNVTFKSNTTFIGRGMQIMHKSSMSLAAALPRQL